jgi:hypothetical protein
MISSAKILFPYSICIFFLIGINGCILPLNQQKLNTNAETVNEIPVESSSGPSEISLAKHLKKTGAKLYGAYWCEHCYKQMYLFGQEAAKEIDRTECDPKGKNSNPQRCTDLKITSYPTWMIDGKKYPGSQSLEFLASRSNYKGDQNFKNQLPKDDPKRFPGGLDASNMNLDSSDIFPGWIKIKKTIDWYFGGSL